MQGDGPYLDAVRLLFQQTARRLGLAAREARDERGAEDASAARETTFSRPTDQGGQLRLF